MKNKLLPIYRISVAILILIVLVLPLKVSANSAVVGSLALGQRSMELSISDREFSAQFTTLNFSLSRSIGSLFVSLNHERSINTDVRSNGNGLIFFDRQDSSLTLSGRVGTLVSLFAGIRQGITNSQYYDGSSSEGNIKSSGAFVGTSINYSVGKSDILSVSIAVAKLSGEATLDEPYVTRIVDTLPDVVEGAALGFSYGLRWTSNLNTKTSFNAQLRLHRYTFEDQVENGIDLSYDENFTSFSLGITHRL